MTISSRLPCESGCLLAGGFWDKLVGWIIPLCGGAFTLRMWHHTFAWGFVVFFILHIYIVLFDDRQFKNGLISSMVAGIPIR